MNIDIQQKINQENNLNDIYAKRLEMMREMARLKEKYNIFPPQNNSNTLNITSIPQTTSERNNNRNLEHNININNKSNDCCSCDCDCINIFIMVFKFFASIILILVCLIHNVALLAYLLSIGWCFIPFSDGTNDDCFLMAPHLHFLDPWKWMYDCLRGIE